jgi:hypothetical protein
MTQTLLATVTAEEAFQLAVLLQLALRDRDNANHEGFWPPVSIRNYGNFTINTSGRLMIAVSGSSAALSAVPVSENGDHGAGGLATLARATTRSL